VTRIDLLRDGLLRPKREAEEATRDSLQEWMEEADEKGVDVSPPQPPAPIAGPCAVCGERAASSTCHQCGRGVCAADQWVMFGLCRTCLSEKELQKARTRSKPRPELDIKWVEDE